MIPRQRRPLFTDEERRALVRAMASGWMAEALLSWLPTDERFLSALDDILRAEIQKSP